MWVSLVTATPPPLCTYPPANTTPLLKGRTPTPCRYPESQSTIALPFMAASDAAAAAAVPPPAFPASHPPNSLSCKMF
eukprot:756547-Hanusia_phi.AAC.5